MLQLAAEEAALIRLTARRVAEQALAGAVEHAAEASPIVREAREQADRLLMDAQEEANRWARRREQEAEARVARAAVAVEELRRRQAGVLRWLRRVRELLEDRDLERALAGLTREAGWPSYAAAREGGRLARVDDALLDDAGPAPARAAPAYPGRRDGDAEIVEEDGGGPGG